MTSEECTIYIVDDDISLCRALARLLRSAGYRNVRTFASAEDLLLEASLEECSVLILDLQLPGMGGVDLIGSLRQSGLATPAILISAHDEELNRARSLGPASTAYLHKPFEEHDLISVIRTFTDG